MARVNGNTTHYKDTGVLTLNTEYTYSVVAASCAGNSTLANTDIFSVKGNDDM